MVFSLSSIVLSVPLKSKRAKAPRGLVDRVADLLHVDFGDNVEAGHSAGNPRGEANVDGLLLYARVRTREAKGIWL